MTPVPLYVSDVTQERVKVNEKRQMLSLPKPQSSLPDCVSLLLSSGSKKDYTFSRRYCIDRQIKQCLFLTLFSK